MEESFELKLARKRAAIFMARNVSQYRHWLNQSIGEFRGVLAGRVKK